MEHIPQLNKYLYNAPNIIIDPPLLPDPRLVRTRSPVHAHPDIKTSARDLRAENVPDCNDQRTSECRLCRLYAVADPGVRTHQRHVYIHVLRHIAARDAEESARGDNRF